MGLFATGVGALPPYYWRGCEFCVDLHLVQLYFTLCQRSVKLKEPSVGEGHYFYISSKNTTIFKIGPQLVRLYHKLHSCSFKSLHLLEGSWKDSCIKREGKMQEIRRTHTRRYLPLCSRRIRDFWY